MLKDKNKQVRIAAAAAVMRSSQAESALDVLLESMKDDSAAIRRAAMAGLSSPPYGLYVKPMALARRQAALDEALKDGDLGVRLHAADGLFPSVSLRLSARSGSSEAVKVLAEALEKGTIEDRRLAMEVLMRVGAGAAPAAEGLAAALRDKDSQIRQYSSYVLGLIGQEAKCAVPGLVEGLKDRVLVVRQLSAQTLGAIGPEAKEAVSGLTKALLDTDATVRLSAVEALGRIGPASNPAVSALCKILKDPPVSTGPGIIEFPGRPPFGFPMTAQPRSFPAGSTAAVVLEALGRIGPGAADSVAEVAALLRENESQRRAAARVLSNLGPSSAPALLEGLKSKDPAMRALCAEALGGMTAPSEEVVKALASALDDSHANVSQQAAFALGQIGESAKSALPQLLTVLKKRQTAPELLRLAAQAIGEMGPAAKEAIPELRDALKSEDALIRKAAAQALGGIGPQAKDAAAALTDLERDPDVHVRRAATRALARINREP
jgi:HEAT repeat protein